MTAAPLGTVKPPNTYSDQPNFDAAFGQNLPILCTILVGVVGLLFVTMGTVKDLPRDTLQFFPLVAWDQHSIILPVSLRDLVMMLSFISGSIYILSGYLSVQAQINDPYAALRDGRITPPDSTGSRKGFEAYLELINSRHNRYIKAAIIAFTCGTVILPLGPIFLFSDRIMSGAIDLYLVLLIIMLVKRLAKR